MISITNKKQDLFNLNLPIDIIRDINNNIQFFIQLDYEYTLYANNIRGIYDTRMFAKEFIQDTNWNKIWYKPTGIDVDLYINWLYYGITNKSSNVCNDYLQAHPTEKYIPHSIYLANKDSIYIKDKIGEKTHDSN